MRNLLNQNIWYWDDAKFVNRSFIIKVTIDIFFFSGDKISFFVLGALSKILGWRRRNFVHCKR